MVEAVTRRVYVAAPIAPDEIEPVIDLFSGSTVMGLVYTPAMTTIQGAAQ